MTLQNRSYAALLAVLSTLCSEPACGGPADLRVGNFESEIDTRLENGDSFRNRISIKWKAPGGPIWGFVTSEYSEERIRTPELGISSPLFDIGPLQENGLVASLNDPVGIGSMRERTNVSLDHSFDGSSLTGGVIRLRETAHGHRTVELFALSREGAAPSGTGSAGASLLGSFGRFFRIELSAKATVFGRRPTGDDWLSDTPVLSVPAVFHAGTRLFYRGRHLAAVASLGRSAGDRTRPAWFANGCLSATGRFDCSLGPNESPAGGFYSARLDAGAVEPDYIGDDGRFIDRTAVVHPVFSFSFSGMTLVGSYGYRVYRRPLLPVPSRRVVHSASLDTTVDFGGLSVGALLRPSVDYAADGRMLFRQLSGLHARFEAGPARCGLELDLTRSNSEPDSVASKLSFRRRLGRTELELCSALRDGVGSLSVGFDVLTEEWRLRFDLNLGEVFGVGLLEKRSGAIPTMGVPFEGGGLSIRWESRRR